MSELDVAKEQIAYLKFWLGILVVTDISLFGWLLSNTTSVELRMVLGGGFAVVLFILGIVLLHRRIERQIKSLREL
jgi:nitrate reductase gamma subunit